MAWLCVSLKLKMKFKVLILALLFVKGRELKFAFVNIIGKFNKFNNKVCRGV